MNFIETLRSVGGVKSCVKCSGTGDRWQLGDGQDRCHDCHGTGQILDLAPLLAKPKELEECSKALIIELGLGSPELSLLDLHKRMYHPYVVGPQRAHSLVYEVARQLGGTAVVAISHYQSKPDALVYDTLSLSIPPDATVLFVTDRFDEEEMGEISSATNRETDPSVAYTPLKYILALISSTDTAYDNNAKVISLHKE